MNTIPHSGPGRLTEREKAGFPEADLLHQSGHAVDDAAFAIVRRYYSSNEIINLTAVEFFPRINIALHISVTPLPQPK